MAFTDILVLLVIITGTCASAVLLRRRDVRGGGLFAAVWLCFYGLVLTAMMLAHSAEILYRVIVGRAAGPGSASGYDFRLYSLLLLGALLIWAGVECLRAVSGVSRGSIQARHTAVRVTLGVIALVGPLIPIQRLFAILLTVLSILTLIVLKVISATSGAGPVEVTETPRGPSVGA